MRYYSNSSSFVTVKNIGMYNLQYLNFKNRYENGSQFNNTVVRNLKYFLTFRHSYVLLKN